MRDLVRILNEEGIRNFRKYLADLRAGSNSAPPRGILTDAWCSAKLPINIEIENQTFDNRMEAAKYLYETLRSLGHSKIDQNVGLWSWLSLYYFDQVCPQIAGGKRRPGQQNQKPVQQTQTIEMNMIDISKIDYSILDWPEVVQFLFHPRSEPHPSPFHTTDSVGLI